MEYRVDNLNVLRRLVVELEYIEYQMHQAELTNDALEGYESDISITIPSEPAC